MPIYEYVCTECKQEFELRRPMADADAPATCPAGHTAGQRVLSLVAAGFNRTLGERDFGGPCQPNGCACFPDN
jgi:putative FmdB family regulatory protein